MQVYVPVADTDRFRVGRKVEIELDSEPGHRVPGEVSFVADTANFTPEKIETRSDRLGQVYRAKVRILEGVERFQPGHGGQRLPGRRRDARAAREGEPVSEPARPPARAAQVATAAGRALAGIDLEIDERQIFGVVGPDGAGKSTLLRALVGLLEVEADEARVLGRRSARRRDDAQGLHRVRAAGLQPAPRR